MINFINNKTKGCDGKLAMLPPTPRGVIMDERPADFTRNNSLRTTVLVRYCSKKRQQLMHLTARTMI